MAGCNIEGVSEPRLQSLSWIVNLLDIRENQRLSQIYVLLDFLQELRKDVFGTVLLVVLLHA